MWSCLLFFIYLLMEEENLDIWEGLIIILKDWGYKYICTSYTIMHHYYIVWSLMPSVFLIYPNWVFVPRGNPGNLWFSVSAKYFICSALLFLVLVNFLSILLYSYVICFSSSQIHFHVCLLNSSADVLSLLHKKP